MKIVTIGRGMIGGGLARLWRDAGHEVDELGRDEGDASNADVARFGQGIGPGGQDCHRCDEHHAQAPGRIPVVRRRSEVLHSRCRRESFNMNFGELLVRVHEQRVRPSNWCVSDEDARDFEDAVWLLMGVKPQGRVFYRFAVPGEL